MSWIIIIALALLLTGGAAEKSSHPLAVKARGNRFYQGGKRRVVDLGSLMRGHPPVYVNGERVKIEDLSAKMALPKTPKAKERPAPIAYAPPASTSPAAPNGSGTSAGPTVDFFQGLLMLVNAPYEKPVDALRQLRSLTEGGRQWTNGLTRLHQRMADKGDMRIDPFVSDHVVRANAYFMAGVLELVESDSALTALLNMTLAEISERGLQIPNSK